MRGWSGETDPGSEVCLKAEESSRPEPRGKGQ